MQKHVIISILLLTLVSACHLVTRPETRSLGLILLPPSEGPTPALYKQKLEMAAKGTTHQLLVVLKIAQSRVKLRGMLPTGQTVYAIEYNGETVIQESNSAIELPSEDILTMLQFALWPSDVLDKYYLADNGWKVDIGNGFRQLSQHNNAKLRVIYLGHDKLVLDNYVHQYQVKIETLEYISL